jgi:hypothetical protein
VGSWFVFCLVGFCVLVFCVGCCVVVISVLFVVGFVWLFCCVCLVLVSCFC